MKHLSEISVKQLQNALDDTDRKTPAQRLITAIAYKNGVTQSELAEGFDVERKTIYNWLTRLEKRDLDEAIDDEQRPGRPRKLTDEQLDALQEMLHNTPTEAGYDVPAWTTDLVQELIRDQFEIEYSRPSCRRLMKELGLSYQTPRKAAAEADPDEREAFEEELKNSVMSGCHSSLYRPHENRCTDRTFAGVGRTRES